MRVHANMWWDGGSRWSRRRIAGRNARVRPMLPADLRTPNQGASILGTRGGTIRELGYKVVVTRGSYIT
jgi:hypothetical protein